jgi:hypothetical protein
VNPWEYFKASAQTIFERAGHYQSEPGHRSGLTA